MSLLLLAGLSALAFQPSVDRDPGVEPRRIYRFHVEQQAALRGGKGWQGFAAGEGAGWLARFDERTGTAHRAWGPGIDLGPVPDAAAVERAMMAFFARHPGLIGVSPSALRLGRALPDPATGSWILRFDRVLDAPAQVLDLGGADWAQFTAHGQPVVWRGGVNAVIRHGRLVMLGVDTYPAADALSARPAVGADVAVSVALGADPAGDRATPHGAVLAVVPHEVAGELSLRLAWVVRHTTPVVAGAIAPARWVSFIDAQTGELFHRYDEVRFATQLSATHDTRSPNGDTSTSPVIDAAVEASGGTVYTDLDGAVSANGSYSTTFNGRYFRVVRDDGPEMSFAWSGASATITTADADIAEIDSYIFLNEIRQWAAVFAYDVPITEDKIQSTVNINQNCNAYYDGTVNFFRAGGGCNNTGRMRDVNHHEWGHGLHASAADTWSVDGSVGEGAGDTVAFLQSGDSTIAPNFTSDGQGIREVGRDRVYPDDVVGQVHTDGLIFGGSVWDLWDILQDDLGPDAAYEVTSRLFVVALQQNPTLDGGYDVFVAADDDDGDLSNGTPHQCQILEAFGRHGLGPGGGGQGLLALEHAFAENAPGDGAVAVEAGVVNLAPTCLSLDVDTADAVFRTGGDWSRAPLAVDGDTLRGAIDGLPGNSIVTYYLEVEDAEGNAVRAPSGGSINPTTFFYGAVDEIRCDDFEDDDGGYTHELVSGQNQEGADDWMWGRPRGLGGDPDFAFSGRNVWGNDLGGGNYNGQYQDDKFNRLSSPPIDISGHDRVILQFRRWLNVEDGVYDAARVRINGEVVWTNHATNQNNGAEHHEDAQWALETVEVPAAALGGEVVVSWEIESDGGLTFGGWTLDDVCFYGVQPVSDLPDDTGDDGGAGDGGGGDGVVDSADPDGALTGDDLGGKLSTCACSSGPRGPTGAALLVGAALGLVIRRRRRG